MIVKNALEQELGKVKTGIVITLLLMMFGVGMGVAFGVQEEAFKGYVSENVDANPQVHDAKSKSKIWRYAQRAHFHSTGISALSLGLILLLIFTRISAGVKSVAATLIALGGIYPFSWFSMFLLAPMIGRGAAHGHIVTEIFTFIGVGGLVSGLLIILSNLLFGVFREQD